MGHGRDTTMRTARGRWGSLCLMLASGFFSLNGCRSEHAPGQATVHIEHAPSEAPQATPANVTPGEPLGALGPVRVERAALDAGTLLAPAWSATGAMPVGRQGAAGATLRHS